MVSLANADPAQQFYRQDLGQSGPDLRVNGILPHSQSLYQYPPSESSTSYLTHVKSELVRSKVSSNNNEQGADFDSSAVV
ncbi:hypothetical protein Ciccas_013718 [Cichlidogyrus casuarinus]|uniref:Uncharacterized protein n=1 Tax=Cichlidogyrus casuarinus TaxID=1844966 RepID=A0ABD2PLP1_9PLAT